MEHFLVSVGLAVATFASTNMDDIFVLVGFFSAPGYRSSSVALGQYLGIGALVGVSLVCALAAAAIPAQYLGMLGLVPIAIGARKLWTGWRDRVAWKPDPARAGGRVLLTVAGVTVANGSDNLGIYIPMFATSTKRTLTVTIAVFVVLTGLWCAAAHFLVRQPSLGIPLRRWGHRLMPFVLVGLGAYILWNGESFTVLTGQLKRGQAIGLAFAATDLQNSALKLIRTKEISG
jgi:cadmium resistance protein CadD (predicted permease)